MKKKITNSNDKLMPNMGGGGGGVIKSASDPASTATAGDLWSDVDNEKLYRRNDANDAWLELANYPVAGDETVNDYTTTIGDYDQAITTATASNNDTSAFSLDQTTEDTQNASAGNPGTYEYSYYVESSSSLVGVEVDSIKLRLKKKNAYSSTATIGIGSTCSDVDIHTFGSTPGPSMSTSSFTTFTYNTGSHTMAAGEYIVLDPAGVNTSYQVYNAASSGDAPAGLTMYKRDHGASCATGGNAMWIEIDGTANHVPTNAINGGTAGFWQSTAAANNWLRLDLGSAKDITAMAMYIDTSVTTETQFLIQSSPDGSAWTTLRTINKTALTDDAYNYIRFNPVNARYFRIYGNSGSSTIMKINEVDLQPFAVDSHGHFGISGTNAALALNGT